VLSTINVNWVVESFPDASFRQAILNGNISVLDGKSPLKLSKLHGYSMKEVVPGSTLIDELAKFINKGIGKKADAAALKFCYGISAWKPMWTAC